MFLINCSACQNFEEKANYKPSSEIGALSVDQSEGRGILIDGKKANKLCNNSLNFGEFTVSPSRANWSIMLFAVARTVTGSPSIASVKIVALFQADTAVAKQQLIN